MKEEVTRCDLEFIKMARGLNKARMLGDGVPNCIVISMQKDIILNPCSIYLGLRIFMQSSNI